jgi:RNA polymerase sigma-70 factor (ECF subfamily)
MWLNSVYQRYADDVYNVIRFRLSPSGLALDADDLLQDVFLTAMDKRNELISHPDIRRWLFATANFKSKNYMRKRASERRHILWDTNADCRLEMPDPSAESALDRILDERLDCADIIWRVKEEMSEAERLLYERAYEDKASPAELSAAYGISEAAMRMRMVRLRRRVMAGIKNVLYNMLLSLFTHIL